MSSSGRRRATPTSGMSTAPSTSSSSSTSTSTGSSRRVRTSSSSAKKRRYLFLDNRCRNPFCTTILENKKQQYCDGNKFCQLRRGLMLLCAWPDAPEEAKEQNVQMEDDDDVPLARLLPTSGANTTGNGDKRPRNNDAPTPTATSSKKSRLLQRHASVDSISTTPTTPTATSTTVPSPSTVTVTTAQQVKAAAIDVVPLGVGNRPGGGGRYVRSGNRAESAGSAFVRPPSFSRFPSAPTTPTGATSTPSTITSTGDVNTAAPPAQSTVSSRSTSASVASSVALAPPNRTLNRANSLPVTTTNRSRDPRVRTGASTTTTGETPAPKTMSAADYLSKIRNREATASSTDPPTSSETLGSARPPDDRSTSTSHSTLPPRPAEHRSARPDPHQDRMTSLRRAQSDTTSHAMPYASNKDWYPSGRDEYTRHLSSFHFGDDWRRPHENDNGYEPPHQQEPYSNRGYANHSNGNGHDMYHSSTANSSNYHRPADSHYTNEAYDRKPAYRQEDQRPSAQGSSSYRTEDRESAVRGFRESEAPTVEQRSVPTPTMSRGERLFRSLLRPKFSHCDGFLKLIMTRMASFLPEEKVGIRAISYKTTTKRKLQWYLNYAKRVEDCCGRLAKLTVENGAARLTIAGREWMVIHGTSTMQLYHDILLRLYNDSCSWRKLIMELKTIHNVEQRTRDGGAIYGVSFLKFWSAMKNNDFGEAADLEFQSTYRRGVNRFHWMFTIENVEVGSGSAENKVDAFKSASATAFAFLNALTILPPEDKYRVAQVDNERRSSPARTSSSTPSRLSNCDSTSCRASGSSSSISRPSVSPRCNVSAPQNVSTTSSSTATTTTRPASASRTESSASRALPSAPASSEPPRQRPVEGRAAPGAITRERSDSWSEPVQLDASFSPVVLSERSVSDDDENDRMSISSREDNTNNSTQSASASSRAAITTSTSTTMAPTKTVASSSAPTPVAVPISAARASTPAAVSASTLAVLPVSTPAAAPAPTPTVCRFCEDIQRTKPGMSCMKCLRLRRR